MVSESSSQHEDDVRDLAIAGVAEAYWAASTQAEVLGSPVATACLAGGHSLVAACLAAPMAAAVAAMVLVHLHMNLQI